jgi:hypothetical protein
MLATVEVSFHSVVPYSKELIVDPAALDDACPE